MRFGHKDNFWLVVDATPESKLCDILFETTLRGLALHFKGGLTMARNPTIFDDQQEAEVEAHGRLVAMRAAQAALRVQRENPAARVNRIGFYDADGKLVFEANLDAIRR
jgi:hypothetical protein